MSSLPATSHGESPRRFRLSLGAWILVGLLVGGMVGWLFPSVKPQAAVLKDVFLNLIKVMLAPLVFSCLVQGIAGGGDLKKMGRIGWKTLLYFEVITTLALLIGLLMVNLLGPGVGVTLPSSGGSPVSPGARPQTFWELVHHAVPVSIVDAMARGDVLQIVVFSVIFALAVGAAGKAGEPVLRWAESLAQVMFKFVDIIMRFAPIGVGAAMAVTVAECGPGVLQSLGAMLLTLYVAFAVFVVLILGTVIKIARIPRRSFLRAVREPVLIAFSTANSESALPLAMENMERLGVSRRIVGFVLPTGYVFNLDGSAVYLTVASVFVAQAAETTSGAHFGLGRQVALVLLLMVASKGVAAVPRAALVVLMASLQSAGLPLEGAALLAGVDVLMDMGRTSVNVFGNCLASAVIARWENDFDDAAATALK
ncbi:MAG TPA: cation:dicarboxylase symporter family transporter [Verrucomicrobiaceae bacterium]